MRQRLQRRRGIKWNPGSPADNFWPYNQKQDFFISVSKKAFLDTEHPAAVIDGVVEKLDLEAVYADYAKEGNPFYHPKMMLKVLFYDYYCGIMSFRIIWDQVIHRAVFIYLTAVQVPNFRTINSFRLRHLERLSGLLTQIVYLCAGLGLIDFEHLAIDGQHHLRGLEKAASEFLPIR
jgi:transposase